MPPARGVAKRRPSHPCAQCGKDFTKRSNMLIHERLHTGERPYVCRYAGCGRSYKWLSSINFHEGRCERRAFGLATPAAPGALRGSAPLHRQQSPGSPVTPVRAFSGELVLPPVPRGGRFRGGRAPLPMPRPSAVPPTNGVQLQTHMPPPTAARPPTRLAPAPAYAHAHAGMPAQPLAPRLGCAPPPPRDVPYFVPPRAGQLLTGYPPAAPTLPSNPSSLLPAASGPAASFSAGLAALSMPLPQPPAGLGAPESYARLPPAPFAQPVGDRYGTPPAQFGAPQLPAHATHFAQTAAFPPTPAQVSFALPAGPPPALPNGFGLPRAKEEPTQYSLNTEVPQPPAMFPSEPVQVQGGVLDELSTASYAFDSDPAHSEVLLF